MPNKYPSKYRLLLLPPFASRYFIRYFMEPFWHFYYLALRATFDETASLTFKNELHFRPRALWTRIVSGKATLMLSCAV